MSGYLPILIFLSDSVFTGLKIIVPLIFLLVLFKFSTKYFRAETAIKTSCHLMLAASVVFIFTLVLNTFSAWYFDNEAEKAMILYMATGPNWYQFFIPVFSYAILPAILWYKPFRTSIYPVFNIVITWIILFNFSDYLTRQEVSTRLGQNSFDIKEYLIKSTVCLVLFSIVYSFRIYRRIQMDKRIERKL